MSGHPNKHAELVRASGEEAVPTQPPAPSTRMQKLPWVLQHPVVRVAGEGEGTDPHPWWVGDTVLAPPLAHGCRARGGPFWKTGMERG